MGLLDPGGAEGGRRLPARIVVRVWSNGALSVDGPFVESKAWCLAALDAAAEAVRDQNRGHALPPPPASVVRSVPPGGLDPTKVPLPENGPVGLVVQQQLVIGVWDDGGLSVEGPVRDRVWCLAAIANAKDAMRAHRTDRALVVPSRDVDVAEPLHPINLRPRGVC